MKELNISKKSWHYHLIKNYTTYYPYQIEDFCSYTRAVMIGIFNVCVIIMMFVMVLYAMIVQEIMYAISGFDEVFIYNNDWLIIGILVWTTCIFISLCYFLKKCIDIVITKIIDYKNGSVDKKVIDKPDSFLYNVYKKFKDKVCYKIEIID